MTSRPASVWDGSQWVQIGPVVNAPIAFQNTEPTSPATGDLWVDADGTLDSLVLNAGDFITQTELNNAIVGKADVAGETYSGTHNFTGATMTGGGLDIVTPTSIAHSGGSASLTGGQVTFTGVSSVSLNGVFTSAYENYRIIVSNAIGSVNVGAAMRLRATGTDSSANYYEYGRYMGAVGNADFVSANVSVFSSVSLFTNHRSMCTYDISAVQLAQPTRIVSNISGENSVGFIYTTFGGCHTQSVAYDGFTIYVSSGNFSGTIRVYGYKNS